MLKKINRKNFLEKYPNFIQSDNYRNKYIFPKSFDFYILYAEAKSTIGLCNNVSKELTKLFKALKYDHLLFLGDNTTPWLFHDHDYKPVKLGLDYLINNKISKSFNGAIQVNIENLTEFMKHLFWLVRCNGIVFYAHFSDADFNIMVSICQYGNLHFSTLNEKTDKAFNMALAKTTLQISQNNNCGDKAISGRTATS